MRSLSLVVAIVASAVVAAGLWIHFDRPVDVQPSWNQPVASVSFAPFRRGQSPLSKVYPSAEQVDQDLHALVGRTLGIRTYTAREGLGVVPDLAAKYGFKVTFGAWLTSEKKPKGKITNEAEIEALIKAANAHPKTIQRVLVGNEVLLRGDLSPEKLIEYIRRVKAAVRQPVSYADVWTFYLRYPEVGREVDYITIHILPFWEDEPHAVDDVEGHIVNIVERIRQTFPGKPILIGEAGWPSIGRDRGPAVVSTVNEARFVRQMAQLAATHHFDYNIVEAFDQPWKSALENTVGAAWGILDVDRKPKFDMAGPVTEVADWPLRATAAIGIGVMLTLLLGRGIPGMAARVGFALMTQLLCWLAVTTAFHAEAVSFRWWQDIWAVLRTALPALQLIAILDRAAKLLSAGENWFADLADRWRGERLLLFSGAYALAWGLLLVFNGRYRDIPEIDFSVPTVGVTLLLLIRVVLARRQGATLTAALALDGLFGPASLSASRRLRLITWLSRGLLFTSVAVLISEGLGIVGRDFVREHVTLAEQAPLILKAMVSNREVNLWAGMQLLMAVPFTASLRLARRRSAEALPEGEVETAG